MVHLNWQDRRRRQVWQHTAIVTGQCRVNTDQIDEPNELRTHRAAWDACALLDHDGHTAMLPGAAKHLSETQSFARTIHFIF